MHLAVFGATGRTGSQIVDEAVSAGHTVRAIGRSAADRDWPTGAEPYAADVLEPDHLDAALDGCDAVVLALSIPRTSRSPFAPLVGPPDLHSRSLQLLLPRLRERSIRRVVKLSAQGVGPSAARAGWLFRALVATSNLRPAFEDHARADALLQASALDWTILRPPMLQAAAAGPGVHPDPDGVTWSWTRVRTGDVAAFAVRCLQDPASHGRTWTLLPR